MATPEDKPSKIVELKQRQAGAGGSPDRLGELLKLVRGIALKRVNGLVSTLFENVDDALFHLAERAESNAVQVQFFDGMRLVARRLIRRHELEPLGGGCEVEVGRLGHGGVREGQPTSLRRRRAWLETQVRGSPTQAGAFARSFT